MQFYNPQTILHTSEGDPFAVQSVRDRGACIDINLLPSSSESEDELKGEASSFIFRLSQNTQVSATGLTCASSDLKPGPTQSEPSKLSHFEHEGTLHDVALCASEGKEDALIDRKKLRLSKEKSAILEGRFKEHSSLNSKQKLALAQQLNLQPRQVEVWFQNRRARTKLKQTQVDCEMLKRCCEALFKENMRLLQEIAELRASMMENGCLIPHVGVYMPACNGSTLTVGSSYKWLTPEPAMVAPATSTTTSN